MSTYLQVSHHFVFSLYSIFISVPDPYHILRFGVFWDPRAIFGQAIDTRRIVEDYLKYSPLLAYSFCKIHHYTLAGSQKTPESIRRVISRSHWNSDSDSDSSCPENWLKFQLWYHCNWLKMKLLWLWSWNCPFLFQCRQLAFESTGIPFSPRRSCFAWKILDKAKPQS